ncbi:MAG: hypothetical protein GY822_04630 [Deltaproteobacteria bacterium]|nr:hypothetical protein [Deltaproteobacteria bacterium]
MQQNSMLQGWLPSQTCCCRKGGKANCGEKQNPVPRAFDDGLLGGFFVRFVDDEGWPKVHPEDLAGLQIAFQRPFGVAPSAQVYVSSRFGPRPSTLKRLSKGTLTPDDKKLVETHSSRPLLILKRW